MPSVTGSPFDDEALLYTASSSFDNWVADRFDVASIKDLSLLFFSFPSVDSIEPSLSFRLGEEKYNILKFVLSASYHTC